MRNIYPLARIVAINALQGQRQVYLVLYLHHEFIIVYANGNHALIFFHFLPMWSAFVIMCISAVWSETFHSCMIIHCVFLTFTVEACYSSCFFFLQQCCLDSLYIIFHCLCEGLLQYINVTANCYVLTTGSYDASFWWFLENRFLSQVNFLFNQ